MHATATVVVRLLLHSRVMLASDGKFKQQHLQASMHACMQGQPVAVKPKQTQLGAKKPAAAAAAKPAVKKAAPQAKAPAEPKKKAAKANKESSGPKVKRAKSAFMFFCSDRRSTVKGALNLPTLCYLKVLHVSQKHLCRQCHFKRSSKERCSTAGVCLVQGHTVSYKVCMLCSGAPRLHHGGPIQRAGQAVEGAGH